MQNIIQMQQKAIQQPNNELLKMAMVMRQQALSNLTQGIVNYGKDIRNQNTDNALTSVLGINDLSQMPQMQEQIQAQLAQQGNGVDSQKVMAALGQQQQALTDRRLSALNLTDKEGDMSDIQNSQSYYKNLANGDVTQAAKDLGSFYKPSAYYGGLENTKAAQAKAAEAKQNQLNWLNKFAEDKRMNNATIANQVHSQNIADIRSRIEQGEAVFRGAESYLKLNDAGGGSEEAFVGNDGNVYIRPVQGGGGASQALNGAAAIMGIGGVGEGSSQKYAPNSVPNDVLAGATVNAESGGKHLGADGKLLKSYDPKSSAAGAGQFLSGTRNHVLKESGIDAWKSPEDALKATAWYQDYNTKILNGNQKGGFIAHYAGAGEVQKWISSANKEGVNWESKIPKKFQARAKLYDSLVDGSGGVQNSNAQQPSLTQALNPDAQQVGPSVKLNPVDRGYRQEMYKSANGSFMSGLNKNPVYGTGGDNVINEWVATTNTKKGNGAFRRDTVGTDQQDIADIVRKHPQAKNLSGYFMGPLLKSLGNYVEGNQGVLNGNPNDNRINDFIDKFVVSAESTTANRVKARQYENATKQAEGLMADARKNGQVLTSEMALKIVAGDLFENRSPTAKGLPAVTTASNPFGNTAAPDITAAVAPAKTTAAAKTPTTAIKQAEQIASKPVPKTASGIQTSLSAATDSLVSLKKNVPTATTADVLTANGKKDYAAKLAKHAAAVAAQEANIKNLRANLEEKRKAEKIAAEAKKIADKKAAKKAQIASYSSNRPVQPLPIVEIVNLKSTKGLI